MDITVLLAKYRSGHQLLTGQLNSIPKQAITFKPDDGSWSIAEVIIHLADSEAHGFVRAKKIIAECGGKVCVYNKQIWAESLFYDKMNHQDALELIRLLRKNLVAVLVRLKAEDWHNYIYHPETGKITLLDWIQLYNDHIDIHIQQIHSIYYSWKKQNEKQFA